MEKVYCISCNDEVKTIKNEVVETHKIKSTEFKVAVILEKCVICGEVAESDETFAENQKRIRAEYCKQNNIITVEQIKELLERYSVAAVSLAKLLGWGEFTVQRYLKGQIPSKPYSDALLNLFKEQQMRDLYDKEGHELKPVARRKLENKLNINTAKMTDVQEVVHYCLQEKFDIALTNMALNKILYYIQGWYMVFFNKPLFNAQFEAWKFGPVIRDVYIKYKEYGKDNLPKYTNVESQCLNGKQKKLIDVVLNAYGNFNGLKLASMSHQEEPWNEAIGMYGENGKGPINDATIKSHFNNMFKAFSMTQIDHIKTAAELCNILDERKNKYTGMKA